jgi:hypothetical protein
MPVMEVHFEVYCTCGAGLCSNSEGGYERVTVKPCPNCLENAKDAGYNEGYADGEKSGYDEGLCSREG